MNILRYARVSPEILILAACEVENERYEGINETGKEFKKRKTNERIERIFEKPMHGKLFREVKEVSCPKSSQWISKGYMSKAAEGFIFAAQVEALPTNWLKAKITGEQGDPKCRRFRKGIETLHIWSV